MLRKGIGVLAVFLFAFGVLRAQEVNGPYLVYKLLKNSNLTLTFANNYQTQRVIEDSTRHGVSTLGGTRNDPTVEYQPDSGYVGLDTLSYEYKDFYGRIKYLSFIFKVTQSFIEIGPDVYAVQKNSANSDILPLVNDISSLGSREYLKVKYLTSNNRLIASIANDSTIRFRPVTDSLGLAYISYTVCDTFNTCENASIVVNVIDTNALVSDTMVAGTPKGISLSIPLTQTGFTTHQSPRKGNLEYNTDYSVLYKPISTFVGNDTFIVVKNNIYRTVFVEVYSVKSPSKLTVDDIVFTPKDSVIVFNVGTNDIVQKYPILKDRDPNRGTLDTLDNQGNFRYVPEAGYEGVQTFTYKVCPQGICEYGEVKIFIGNWQPDNRQRYAFSTPKNVPIMLGYHIPIDAYNFSSSEDSIKFYPGYDTVEVRFNNTCVSTVMGYNLLFYHPPLNFAGTRSFTIRYCIPSTGQCIDAQCDVTIYDESKNCNKQCAGDCVWPGDVNLDGHVSMPDFLQIGYNLGNEGSSRNYPVDRFRAYKANDWSKFIPGSLANLKHADADGNGKVESNDTNYVSMYYRQQHSLIPKPVYARGDFPFILNVLTPNAQPGDIGLIEVQLGDANYPAINLGGYSYELDYNLSVVDENSLAVSFYQKGWATLNSALMHMFKKPWNGRLESGFVRANGNRVSGKGGVEVISFIVEDDLGGFRKGERYVKIPFYFSNIITIDEHGQLKSLPDQVAYINIGISSEEEEPKLDPSKLLVYPNPAPEWMNIHLNGANEMEDISIISVNGAEIKKIKANDAKHHVLNLNSIQNGLYLLIVNTKLGPITKKIEIFR